MRKIVMRLLLAVLVVSAPMGSAFAQEIQCTNDEVIQDCFNKFVPALMKTEMPAKEAEEESAATKKLSAANTGLSNLVGPSASSVLDFLSLLSASLQSTTFDRNAQTFTLDFNLPVGMAGRDDQVKFQAVLAKPKIGSDVEQKLGTNAAAIKALNDAFNIGDDITASATYNPVNRYFGRSIAPHRVLFQAMLMAAVRADAEHNALVRFRAARRELHLNDPSKTFLQAASNDPQKADDFRERLIEGFQAEGVMNKAFTPFAQRFTELLNNQPQRYLSLLYHDRQNTVGPKEWSGKLSWEFGSSNLNDFYNNEGKDCAAISAGDERRGSDCLTQFDAYVKRNNVDTTAAINRYALSAEYHSTSSVNVDLPLYTLTFNAKGGHTLVYKATWGRSLDPTMGDHEARLDAAVNYEDNSKDATKKDRWVGSVTYTVKYSAKVSIPVSLIYANHQQYLGDVNKKLSAHFGLNYKLPTK